MKVAIMSSASAGGAGIAAFRVYQALKSHTDFDVDFIDISLLDVVSSNVSPTVSATNNRISNTHFTIDNATEVRDWIIDYLLRYDVINIHWASYLISLSEILELAKLGKKILFTFHDYYYFTGGCHYPSSCRGFEKSCVGCPQVDEAKWGWASIMDAHKIKREIFSHANVHVSAPSQFLIDAAVRSGIVSSVRSHVIRNAYLPAKEVPSKADSFSILLIADSFSEKRKGLSIAVNSLNQVASILRDVQIEVNLVGGVDNAAISLLTERNIKAFAHGHIKEHEKLISVYKQSRFILTASLEDNWPNILVEGGCYGCIPIVGPSHGCEEFVKYFGVGNISASYATEDFAAAICKSYETYKLNQEFLDNFATLVRDAHSFELVANSYAKNFLSMVSCE